MMRQAPQGYGNQNTGQYGAAVSNPNQAQAAQNQVEGGQQAASNKVFSVDTQHEDNINDCQFDYYGTQIASCDSNGFLQIRSVRNGGQTNTPSASDQHFKAHSGPIWQVSWAHPKYESVIATCGYDGMVKVWKRDQTNNGETPVYQYELSSSVNCIAWAPWEYGLILAAGTAEGRVVIFEKNQDDTWEKTQDFIAHQTGVNGISWGPATEPAILADKSANSAAAAGQDGKFQPPAKRIVTGGNDNEVQLWELRGEDTPLKTTIGSHGDWVRDVAWCSNIGLMHEMIASCSEDGTCKVWVSSGADAANKGQPLVWQDPQVIQFENNVPLWKVSWSQVGNMLAISGGDNQVRIMSENETGVWSQIQVVNEETSQESSGAAGPSSAAQ